MPRSQYPLNGAWAKYDQAAEHLTRFENLFHDFAKSNPFARIVRAGETLPDEPDDGFGSDEVWYELSCTAGDCVHNLRSALDHAAHAVAKSRGMPQAVLESVYFTVRDKKPRFDAKVRKMGSVEQQVGAGWIAFLESVQPFTDTKYENLGRIVRLDNIDKHRVIVSLTPRADVFVQRPGEEPKRWTVDLAQGRVRIPVDEPGMMISTPYLTFEDTPTRSQPLPAEQDLLEFYSLVGDVLRAVKEQFF